MTAILKRKLAEAQRDRPRGEMTALRALRLSVARAGEDLLGLALGVVAVRQQRMLPDDMADLLSDEDLLLVLDCPNGQTGAAAFALPAVTSLIQQQTMGCVSDRAPDPRDYTDTDAAMCAPLVERLLKSAANLAEAEADQACFKDIRFGAKAEDMRSLHLGLRANKYRVFWMTLDIALGKHQAEVVIALPERSDVNEGTTKDFHGDADSVVSSPLLEVPTELDAVLARLNLSVSELNALQVGATLTLERGDLDDTALMTRSGEVVARGRLGQMKGSRALRLMAARDLPRAANEGFAGAFDALSGSENDIPDTFGVPPMAPPDLEIGGTGFPSLDATDDSEALAVLSPAEAAEQIGELAGLSVEDLGTDETAVDAFADGAGLPALSGENFASAFPPGDLPPIGEFAAAPIDLDEDTT